MKTQFSTINNISELSHLRNESEFVFRENGDLTTVFYAVAFPHTFGELEDTGLPTADAMLRRECRGITFETETGYVVSRPYHKFFNINEREETQEGLIDFAAEHQFLEKLDGSMIRPVYMNGELRLFTKAGLSEVAEEAEKLAMTDDVASMCKYCIQAGYTPIFEYVGSPKFPVVLQYEEPALIVTAIRDVYTGRYLDYDTIEAISANFGIEVVKVLSIDGIEQANTGIKDMIDGEGYVIRFEDGHMLKIKCEWYLRRHRAKDAILVPRKLVRLILENDIDDLKPDLSDRERTYVVDFEDKLKSGFDRFESKVLKSYDIAQANSTDRKEFAIAVMKLDTGYSHILFKLIEGRDITELLVADIIKSSTKDRTWEKYDFLVAS